MTLLKGDKLTDWVKSIQAKKRTLYSTGVIPMDMVMGGGFIEGDFIEVASESGTGKSTALLDMSEYLMSQGMKVGYLDTEFSIKESEDGKVSMLESTGVAKRIEYPDDPTKTNFLVLNPSTYTELENALIFLLDNGFKVAIVDSITEIIPEGLLDRGVEQVTIGEKARVQTTFLEKYRSLCKKAGLTVFLVNQMKTKIGIGFGEKTEIVSGGSKSLKYLCDIWIRIKGAVKLSKKEFTGHAGEQDAAYGCRSLIYTEKCRSERGYIPVPFPVIYGKGISNPYFYFEILKARKVLKYAGSWISLEGIPDVPTIKKQGELPIIQEIAKYKDQIHAYIDSINGFDIVIPDAENPFDIM